MPAAKNAQSGFSLVELLVAVVILAVGLLGLAELQITAMRGNSKSGSVMSSMAVAQTAIEEIMAVKSQNHYLHDTMLTIAANHVNWPEDPEIAAHRSMLSGGVVDVNGDGRNDYSVTFISVPDAAGDDVTRVTVEVVSLGVMGFGSTTARQVTLKNLKKLTAE